MASPVRRRNVYAGVFLSGGVTITLAFLLPESATQYFAQQALFSYGIMALTFGGFLAYTHHAQAKAGAAIARRENILAHWRVDSQLWQQFAAGNHSFVNELLNEVPIDSLAAPDGLDIFIADEAIQVGDSIHVLPRKGTPEVTHACLASDGTGLTYAELRLYYPGGGTGASGVPHPPRRAMLRFPVPAEARPQAEAAISFYHKGRPGASDFFHGSGDGTDKEDLSECIVCGHRTFAFRSHCPKCGSPIQSRRWSRRYGALLVCCGLFVSAMMSWVLYYAVPLLLQPGQEINGYSFSGNALQAFLVLGILLLVTGFGISTLLYGLWQMLTGRRSMRFIAGVLTIMAIVVLGAMLLRIF